MSSKNTLIGTIVGAVVLYILMIVLWDMLFLDFLLTPQGSATGLMKESQDVWAR